MVEEQRNIVRAQIAQRAVQFVRRVRGRNTQEPNIDTGQPRRIEEQIPDHLIVSTHTGSGKTTSVMKALDEIGVRWIYIAPYHEVITENIEDSSVRYYNFLHLKGRKECCQIPENRQLAEAGIDISGFCDECPFKHNICVYERNIIRAKNHRPNLGLVHAHIHHWLPRFLDTSAGDGLSIRDMYHVVIIDENPISCFIQSLNVSRQKLSYIYQCMLLTKLQRVNPLFQKLLNFMDLLMEEELNYSAIQSFPLDDVVSKRHMLMREYSHRIGELLQQNIISHAPVDVLSHILNLWDFRIGNDITKMIYWREHVLTLSFFNRFALDFGLPIIALDGTANEEVWRHMLHTNNFEMFYKDYSYSNVYQGIKGRYSIGSWTRYGDNTAIYLTKYIAKIAKTKRRNVLVIGTKKVNRKIRRFILPYGINNVEYATYYFLRSKNSFYKTCDTIILACEPNPPQEAIISCVSLSGWDESVWRMIYREEEMKQAIGRIRQNINRIKITDTQYIERERMEIYILPNTGVLKEINPNNGHPVYKPTLLNGGSRVILMTKPEMVDTAESGDAVNTHMKILMALKNNNLGITNISKEVLNQHHNTVTHILIQMYNDELITKRGSKYVITQKGMDQISQRVQI